VAAHAAALNGDETLQDQEEALLVSQITGTMFRGAPATSSMTDWAGFLESIFVW
jgi:hypothetical protein